MGSKNTPTLMDSLTTHRGVGADGLSTGLLIILVDTLVNRPCYWIPVVCLVVTGPIDITI